MLQTRLHHLQPYRFQRLLIELLITTPRRDTYLALEQGLGKTMIVLLAWWGRGAPRCLVICPAIGGLVWVHEASKWLPLGNNAQVLAVRKARYLPPAIACFEPTLCVISYDTISRHPDAWFAAIRRFDPQIVVLDEAHRLKSSDAICTRTIYGPRCDGTHAIVEHADRIWALSGTPCPNNTAELWTYLRACAPDLITVPLP